MGATRRREAPAPGHHAGPGRGCRRPPSGAGPSSFLPISRRRATGRAAGAGRSRTGRRRMVLPTSCIGLRAPPG